MIGEPTVEVPAWIVVLSCKHFYHLSKQYQQPHDKLFRELSDKLTKLVSEQCSNDELNQAMEFAVLWEKNNEQARKYN